MPWTTRKTRPAQAASAAVIVVAALAMTASPATAQDPAIDRNRVMHGFVLDDGEFDRFDVPGASHTVGSDITNRGTVVGASYDADDLEQHGFTRDRRGRIETVEVPNHDGDLNYASGGGDRGEVFGNFGEYADDPDGEGHGYRRDKRGRFETIDFPGAVITAVVKGNNRGQVGGAYNLQNSAVPNRTYRGFVYDDGKFTRIDAPGATYTLVTDLNDRGDIVGIGIVPDPLSAFGWLRTRDGKFVTLPDVPDSFQTIPFGINNKGQIAGAYLRVGPDGIGRIGGYLLDDGELTMINVPGASSTQISAINDHGEMTGFYTDPPMQTQARGGAAATPLAVPPGDPHALVDMWRLPNRVVPDPRGRVP